MARSLLGVGILVGWLILTDGNEHERVFTKQSLFV